ncbi:hypothetical protein AVEN_206915-1 [Araneus ventricosus]|uniref:Uncharacterized protein n=1 Tax=Araneus ventricosus TaxID=182803 RepID=A0A4Y2IT12_ARAVE|nr:hypothetical protein AVEN_206915-1 [Araneus ventricosus]
MMAVDLSGPPLTPGSPYFETQSDTDDGPTENTTAAEKPAGVFAPKLSRILPRKGAVSPSPAWLKKIGTYCYQNPMAIRRFFIIVIEKYLGKESNSKTCVPISG